MSVVVDALGKQCPIPVVMAKKALAELQTPDTLEILVDNEDHCVRIPMWGDIRSLNLSNSAAIVLYEALRQHGFEKLALNGQLHHLHWKDE